MKKKIMLIALLTLAILALAGCGCEHEWAAAGCTAPSTCSLCGETEGEALGHSFGEASCAAPSTCSLCGETQGEALPHNYADATCAEPKTCPDCGATEGEALGHEWTDATYSAPKTCSVCEETEGEPLKRANLGYSNDEMASLMGAILEMLGGGINYLGDDEDGWPVFEVYDIASGASVGVNITFEPYSESLVYAVAIYTDAVSDATATAVLGVVAASALVALDENFDTEALAETLQTDPQMTDGTAVYYMESCGLAAEMQVSEQIVVFWIYPAA